MSTYRYAKDPPTRVQVYILSAIFEQANKMYDFISAHKMEHTTFGIAIVQLHVSLLWGRKPGLYDNTAVLKDMRTSLLKLKFADKELANFMWIASCDAFIYPNMPQDTTILELLDTAHKCRRLVLDYIEYCELRHKYYDYYFHPPPDCDCSDNLQSFGIAKKEANDICRKLGALLVRHLQYITYADIETLSISDDSKTKLKKAYTDVVYASATVHASTIAKAVQTKTTSPKEAATTTTHALLHMRGLLTLKYAPLQQP